VRGEVTIILSIVTTTRAEAPIKGHLESRYGGHDFTGWLDLMGRLEAIADEARHDLRTKASRTSFTD
jgi:hypothetical protein